MTRPTPCQHTQSSTPTCCAYAEVDSAGGGQVPVSTKIILSSHNFESTPSDKSLEDTLQQMWASGADVAKIATMAKDITDCARVLTLLKTSQGTREGLQS